MLDLVAESQSSLPSWPESLEPGLHIDEVSTETLIDETARAQYKRGIAELQREIDEAGEAADPAALSAAREECDTLVGQLSAAYGIGGRARRAPDHVERARKTVTRRIRDAIGRIERVHPTLGRSLKSVVHTGSSVVTNPNGKSSGPWRSSNPHGHWF